MRHQFSVADTTRIVHEAMRVVQQILGDPNPAPPFDEASPEMIASAMDGVKGVMMEQDLTAEELHQRWVDYKRAEGWTYGPVKDEAGKRHPSMAPWNQLPDSERRKDVLFMAMVVALTAPLDDDEEENQEE